MTDFLLTPDEVDFAEAPTRGLRLVATGLAPTADVPRPRRQQPDPPPCYGPCPGCGGLVLTGLTPAGVRLALDTHIATYTVLWLNGTPEPLLHASRGYPVHHCPQHSPTGKESA